jgi:molecular chaperone DnaJ
VLRGHGMPKLRSGARGDLNAHLEVVVPSKLDNKQAKLLEDYRRHSERDRAEVVSNGSQHSGGLFSRLRDAFSAR